MRKMRSILAALLAALMLLTAPLAALAEAAAPAAPLTLEALEALGARPHPEDGRVTFVEGPCTEGPVTDMPGARRVVEAMIPLLGGDARTQFEPWRTLTDAVGNRYYVFQQMYAGTTVSGGAVKVVTDGEGNMLGLVSSVEGELPETAAAEGIDAARAQALVLERMQQDGAPSAELVEGRTEKVILPVNLELDPDIEEEKEENRYVWAVYTDNPMGNVKGSLDLPYLAHYVTMEGEYLYSLPTIVPGDEAATSGYDAAYLFEFMEPVDYTGTVTLSDGTEQTIELTLMRDGRTGMVYLGNLERRIVVADCHPFIYDHGRVVVEASADNTGWDETCLLALYNYCRAWDYYEGIGWTGGDGLGTPTLILKDYCSRDHEPIDNAAYAGKYYGWQVFLSSAANDYAQCLDVLAHEFTHCVTGSVMTFNAYKNDYGAINEAISDIQGNLCEMMMGATEDTAWLLGENSAGGAIRSMSDPHRFRQPDYSWDLHYVPEVKVPTDLNDRGGVHNNSSLLNNVAWRLLENGGMSLDEARSFWFAVDCAMVPGTDYAQLSLLLPWVLKSQGLEGYTNALEAAIDATRMHTSAIPDTFDDDRALVTLTLPEGETFEDGNWMLLIATVDVPAITRRAEDIFARRGECADALSELAAAVGVDPALLPDEAAIQEDPEGAWAPLVKWLESQTESAEGGLAAQEKEKMIGALAEWVRTWFGEMFFAGSGAAGQDGRTVRMVARPGTTVPVLFRLELDSDMDVVSAGLAVYTLGEWFDLGEAAAELLSTDPEEPADEAQAENPADASEDLDLGFLDGLLGQGGSESGEETGGGAMEWIVTELTRTLMDNMGWLKNLLFYEVKPGQVNRIPDGGLEKVTVVSAEDYPVLNEMFDEAEAEDAA
ncbi:MAG: M4 family metallopeptidase [Clostridia bacterium]|nr:M4 family metallopeptidase [Clostridia bacterium]